jgi:copper chaperone NosL
MMKGACALPLAVAVLLPGCERGGQLAPPEIHYGQDVCAACNMIISEERFATAMVLEPEMDRYASLAFDDVGCMFEYEKKDAELPIAARYVHDHETGAWIEAALATYVLSPAVQTPMGSGVIACEANETAQSLLRRHTGELLSWSELSAKATAEGLLAGWAPSGEE